MQLMILSHQYMDKKEAFYVCTQNLYKKLETNGRLVVKVDIFLIFKERIWKTNTRVLYIY